MKCLLPARLRALRAVPCSCPQSPQEVVALAALLARGETEAAPRGCVTYPGRVSRPCRARWKPGGGALGSTPNSHVPAEDSTEDSRVWASTSFVIRIWGLEDQNSCVLTAPSSGGAMMTPLSRESPGNTPKAVAHPICSKARMTGGGLPVP